MSSRYLRTSGGLIEHYLCVLYGLLEIRVLNEIPFHQVNWPLKESLKVFYQAKIGVGMLLRRH